MRHNVEIHSHYIVLSYKLKPIFFVTKPWNMDHVDINLIHQVVSVEKYTYAQVSDYLKTKYSNSRRFSQHTVRRYCKDLPELMQMKLTEWLQMTSVRLSYVWVSLIFCVCQHWSSILFLLCFVAWLTSDFMWKCKEFSCNLWRRLSLILQQFDKNSSKFDRKIS